VYLACCIRLMSRAEAPSCPDEDRTVLTTMAIATSRAAIIKFYGHHDCEVEDLRRCYATLVSKYPTSLSGLVRSKGSALEVLRRAAGDEVMLPGSAAIQLRDGDIAEGGRSTTTKRPSQ